MNVTLFVPCFVDAIYPRSAICAVEILERLGHTVSVPRGLTCCGQPAFNSGYWDEARQVGNRVLRELRRPENIVVLSGSCGAMIKVFYPEIFENKPEHKTALEVSERVWEFSDFLVNKLGVEDLGAQFDARVTFHDGCHGLRELGVKDAPRKLLKSVRGLELVEMQEAETCCGFGGTFAVKFPEISTAMGEVKCASAVETGTEYIVSNDGSCLMHLQGLMTRQKTPMKTIHLAEILNSLPGSAGVSPAKI